jgi:hypothetical protein
MPDTLITNASVITMDPQRPAACAPADAISDIDILATLPEGVTVHGGLHRAGHSARAVQDAVHALAD